MAGRASDIPMDGRSYFVPEGSRMPQGWRAKLVNRYNELSGYLAHGAAPDFPDYRYRVGQLEGLRQAMEICAELEKEEGN